MTPTQIRNVVTFYFLEMCKAASTPGSASRDCLNFNKERGRLCARVYKDERYTPIMALLHQAENVQQINSSPVGQCYISKMVIPNLEYGVQLIIRSKDSLEHVIIRKEYQSICFAYFKMRYFNRHIQQEIRKWLTDRSWYMPKLYKTSVVLQKLLDSTFCSNIYIQYNECVDILRL
jgi:hypothetical protein